MKVIIKITLATALLWSSHQTLMSQEFGIWYDGELQTDFKGHCNYVNLLYLNADYPLTDHLQLRAASISVAKTRSESLLYDLQTFSNIEADNQLFALALAGLGWQMNERHSLYVGIRNVNEDYFVSPVTSLFVNSSCGIFPTLSCNMDIANYPLASLGVHYSYRPSTSFGLLASVYNGQGYSSLTGSANIWRFTPQSDGLFGITQIDWQRGKGQYFVGMAQHGRWRGDTANQTALWAYTEQTLTEQFALIADCSYASGRSCQCLGFLGIGSQYARGNSTLGLFTDYASFRDDSEWATELTYKLDLTKYLFLQASCHLIRHGRWQSVGLVRMSLRI